MAAQSACCGPAREDGQGTPSGSSGGPLLQGGAEDGSSAGSLVGKAGVSVSAEGPGAEGREATAAPPVLLEKLAGQAPDQLALVGLAGGTFLMGSEDRQAYSEDWEGPVRPVEVAPFGIGSTTVTVAQFAVFVLASGHRTDAEIFGDSLVFEGLVVENLRDELPSVAAAPWWKLMPGATWFSPEGRDSTVHGREDHPVTHVSQRDAQAYAQWAGVRLPEEAEWEFAARGGLVQQPYPWGAERDVAGTRRMNIFPGDFPHAPAGAVGTVPARSFEPNGYGLYNTTGNVWEWTAGVFAPGDERPVMRGGSYMCHESYCQRYRTSARSASTEDTSLGHTGFRVAVST